MFDTLVLAIVLSLALFLYAAAEKNSKEEKNLKNMVEECEKLLPRNLKCELVAIQVKQN